jgi:hypothetical protein
VHELDPENQGLENLTFIIEVSVTILLTLLVSALAKRTLDQKIAEKEQQILSQQNYESPSKQDGVFSQFKSNFKPEARPEEAL